MELNDSEYIGMPSTGETNLTNTTCWVKQQCCTLPSYPSFWCHSENVAGRKCKMMCGFIKSANSSIHRK